MLKRITSCAAAALLAIGASSSPVLAKSDAGTVRDVRCVIIMLSDIQSPDKETASQATGGYIYYLGRIEGRTTFASLRPTIKAEVEKMLEVKIDAERKSCFKFMADGGKQAQDVMKSIGQAN